VHGLAALPAEPQTVGRYVAALATTGPAIPRLRRDRGGAATVDSRPAIAFAVGESWSRSRWRCAMVTRRRMNDDAVAETGRCRAL